MKLGEPRVKKIYRPVDAAVHADRRYRSWDDSTKLLWMTLMTHPRMLPIPGVILQGQGGLCDLMKWSPERLAKPFAKLLDEGCLKHDPEACLMFLPKAVRRNPPHNGNVVKGWANWWDQVPECTLKDEIKQVLKPFAKPFAKRFPELFTKQNDPPYATQEQEQEQDQEQEQELKNMCDLESHTECAMGDPCAIEPVVAHPPKARGKPRPKPKLDLAALYEIYPRKRNRKRGLLAAEKTIKTPETYAKARAAMERMRIAWDPIPESEMHWCQHFSTFCNGEEWDSEELPLPRQRLARGTSQGGMSATEMAARAVELEGQGL